MTQSVRPKPTEMPIIKAEQCPICWDDPMTDRIETVCGHVFDKYCLDTWLKDHTTCPMCRTILKETEFDEDYSCLLIALINFFVREVFY